MQNAAMPGYSIVVQFKGVITISFRRQGFRRVTLRISGSARATLTSKSTRPPTPLHAMVYARHGRWLMGFKSPVRDRTLEEISVPYGKCESRSKRYCRRGTRQRASLPDSARFSFETQSDSDKHFSRSAGNGTTLSRRRKHSRSRQANAGQQGEPERSLRFPMPKSLPKPEIQSQHTRSFRYCDSKAHSLYRDSVAMLRRWESRRFAKLRPMSWR